MLYLSQMKNYFHAVHLSFCFLIVCNNILAQNKLDSAKKTISSDVYTQSFINTCFFIADEYMDLEQYDSAQIWLNKIHEKLPAKKPSLFNYFLITRQAEVYYYNNLQQLGLRESYKGLAVAQALNDSLLLADSYNFLGLFYMNLDSSKEAITFYKNGLRYSKQPPYPPQYLSLTKPHHLYGNMSEAFYKLTMYDSALVNIQFSLQKAYQINWGRGIAVGHASAGDIYFAMQNRDSAFYHYNAGILASKKSNDVDVELICIGGIAKCFDKQNNSNAAKIELNKAFDLLKNNPSLNRFYALQFLDNAIGMYKKMNEPTLLAKALEIKSSIETANVKSNNAQIQTILNAGVANEKRLLSLEVTEAKQRQNLANTRLIVVLIAFGLLALGFLLYRNVQKQKFATEKMRQKISQDLHDDIGASLSSLQIYSAIAEETVVRNPTKAKEMVQKIALQSRQLMENMNDIVWSMKSLNDAGTSLEVKIKNYGSELLIDKNINFNYIIEAQADAALTSINTRKNILLVIKEAMNNIAKYSKATTAELQLVIKNKHLYLYIMDNGIGFNMSNNLSGNGLKNMQQRIEELKGTLTINTLPLDGCTLEATIPLATINDV